MMNPTYPRSRSYRYGLLLLVAAAFLLGPRNGAAKPWPGGPETAIPIAGVTSNLSGATWNPLSQTFWVIHQDGEVWELAYDATTQEFTETRTVALPSGIGTDLEGLAQVDLTHTDVIYTLSEDGGRVARVAGLDSIPVTEAVWRLETLNNGQALPPETAGLGAEGIEFVPDADLLANEFTYPNGSAFTGSTKGMGGLIFIGHEAQGRLHVFDLNPDVSNDFVNHGSFLSTAQAIVELAYDRSSRLMYIFSDDTFRSVEVVTLSSKAQVGRLDSVELYDSGVSTGNIEGIAVVGREFCGEFGSANDGRAFLMARDSSVPNVSYTVSFPCDCTGSAVEAEFDACVASGSLSGGCSCLDLDRDGDVDCDDFAPSISAQCATAAPSCGGPG